MQEQKSPEADHWGRFAASYDRNIDKLFGKELRLHLAGMLEAEGDLGNVVELGCGTGYFTLAIARHAKHVTATDISPRMIEAAEARLKGLGNVSFQVENSEKTSLPAETFDAVLMANVLHTLDRPENALRECHRILNRGGTLLIINYTDQGMGLGEKAWLLFRFAMRFGLMHRRCWPVTTEKLRGLLASAGFRVERMELVEDRINTIYARSKKA